MQQSGGWNAVFWCNHDQPRAVSRFGNDKKYHKQSAKMLATMLHMLRGTPYIYQGEELGMTNAYYTDTCEYRDVESLNYYNIMLENGKTREEALEILRQRSRDNGRTPMQWNNGSNAGFTDGTPWIMPSDNYKTINAKAEEGDEDSILNYYKRLIRLRKENTVISDGQIDFFSTKCYDVFAYRRFRGRDEMFVINNLSEKEIALMYIGRISAKKVIGNYAGIKTDNGSLILRPYESIVYNY